MQLGGELHSTVFRTEFKRCTDPAITPETEKTQVFAGSKKFSCKCTECIVHARSKISLAPDSEITEAGY